MREEILGLKAEAKEKLEQAQNELNNERKNVEKAKEAYSNTIADFDQQIFDLQRIIANLNQEQVSFNINYNRKLYVIT